MPDFFCLLIISELQSHCVSCCRMQMGSWLCRSFRKGQRQTLPLFRHCHSMTDLCRNVRWVEGKQNKTNKKTSWSNPQLLSDPRCYVKISVKTVEFLFHQSRLWKTKKRRKATVCSQFVLMNYSNGPLVYWQCNIVAALNKDGNISLPNVMHGLLPIVADILLSVLSTMKRAYEDICILCKCSVYLFSS